MSKERAKGTRFENESVEYLRREGIDAFRLEFSSPLGDLGGVPGCTTECKDQKEQRLGYWLDQVHRSAARKSEPTLPVVIHKRRMKTGGENYVTMKLSTFVLMIRLILDLLEDYSGNEDARLRAMLRYLIDHPKEVAA